MLQEPSIGFISILFLIGSAQGLILALALVFMRRGNRRANLILAALLLTLSVMLIDGFMKITNYGSQYPRLVGMSWPAFYLVAPFFYFYVRELSSPKKMVFSWTQLLHFLPMTFFILLIFYSIFAHGRTPGWACSCVLKEGGQINFRDVALYLLAFQKTIYYILSFRMVATYSARIKQSFSSLNKISLSWLRTLLFVFFTLFFTFIFFMLFSAHFGIQREIVFLVFLSMVVITSVMAFKVLLQPEIFLQFEIAHRAELIRTGQSYVPEAYSPNPDILQNGNGRLPKEKYRKTYLTDERAAEIAHKLVKNMETKKPYLEPELKLPQLADSLAVSPNELSQVINREMNKSFFEFVNEYRVKEAKRLLSSPKYGHLSIMGIALDAGFNSKSAFYNAFSKHIGTTPSGFRKQCALPEQGTQSNLQGHA